MFSDFNFSKLTLYHAVKIELEPLPLVVILNINFKSHINYIREQQFKASAYNMDEVQSVVGLSIMIDCELHLTPNKPLDTCAVGRVTSHCSAWGPQDRKVPNQLSDGLM